MNRFIPLAAAVAVTAALAASPAAAVTVASNQSIPTVLGAVIAGQSYTLTVTGLSTLCGSCNGGGPLTFNPDGTPAVTPVGAYAGFAPNGADFDPASGNPGAKGRAGAGINLGALAGTYSIANTSPFLIGYGGTFTAGMTGTLFGYVNDTNYNDNPSSGFSVTLADATGPTAVPEPAAWAMMLLGFGLVGTAARRRRMAAFAAA